MPVLKSFLELAKPGHYRLKPKAGIPIDLKEKVKANKPFAEYFDDNTAYFHFDSKETFSKACEYFLTKKYPKLQETGVSFKIEDCEGDQFDIDWSIIKSYQEKYNLFAKLASAYTIEWNALNNERKQLLAMKPFSDIPSEKFSPLNFFLNDIAYVYERKDDAELRAYLNIYKYYQVDSIEGPIVLPNKYLAEIMMACPVWFETNTKRRNSFFDNTLIKNRLKDLHFFYNPQISSFNEYDGEDDILDHIHDSIKKYNTSFDTLSIATPYHHKAKKLSKYVPPSPPNIDPYLIGFREDLPNHFFILERWCKGGIFPLMDEMIADTVSNLQVRKDALQNERDTAAKDLQGRAASYVIEAKLKNRQYNWFNGSFRTEENVLSFLGELIHDFKHNNLIKSLK
jgi:hypothetical protein